MTEMAKDFIETQINKYFACKVIRQRNKKLHYSLTMFFYHRTKAARGELRANYNKTEILFFFYSALSTNYKVNQHAIDNFKLIVEIHVLASETFTTKLC